MPADDTVRADDPAPAEDEAPAEQPAEQPADVPVDVAEPAAPVEPVEPVEPAAEEPAAPVADLAPEDGDTEQTQEVPTSGLAALMAGDDGRPPEPRPRRGILVGLGAAVVALAIGIPVAVVATAGGPQQAATPPGASASAGPQVGPGGGPPTSPPAGTSPDDRFLWIKWQVDEALAAQGAALEAGDLPGFLAAAEPGNTGIAAELRRRFGSLRAMQVKRFSLKTYSGPLFGTTRADRGLWNVVVSADHCFVEPNCNPSQIRFQTWWKELPAGVRMVRIGTVRAEDNGPHPWEVSDLTVSVGKRTLVAAPKGQAGRVRSVQAVAEKAAAVADRYLLMSRPDRYLVFLAGKKEWGQWFGGDLPTWSIGYALGAGNGRSDVVLQLGEIDSGYLDDVLRHEFGHVVTVGGDALFQQNDRWWLTEGIAEYIAENGRPVARYEDRPWVRQYLRQKTWKGDLDGLAPTGDDKSWQVTAKYGLAYYATRCIGDRFGRAKLMEFTDLVLRNALSADAAAGSVLGKPWATVEKDCLAYTRKAAG